MSKTKRFNVFAGKGSYAEKAVEHEIKEIPFFAREGEKTYSPSQMIEQALKKGYLALYYSFPDLPETSWSLLLNAYNPCYQGDVACMETGVAEDLGIESYEDAAQLEGWSEIAALNNAQRLAVKETINKYWSRSHKNVGATFSQQIYHLKREFIAQPIEQLDAQEIQWQNTNVGAVVFLEADLEHHVFLENVFDEGSDEALAEQELLQSGQDNSANRSFCLFGIRGQWSKLDGEQDTSASLSSEDDNILIHQFTTAHGQHYSVSFYTKACLVEASKITEILKDVLTQKVFSEL